MNNHAFSEYTEHKTGAEIGELLHHGHWIPATKGLTQRHVDENFPGYDWGRLMEIWRAAGIVVRPPGGAPLRCNELVQAVHFNGPGSWAVEWIGGIITTS